ncbi:MAG: hypothetical protein IT246_03075, partial [Bacteroidia bacterium]|nr:hypothetical protein [Bacteroidia bacterium]
MKKIYILLLLVLSSLLSNQTVFGQATSPTYYNFNTGSPSNIFPWATAAGKGTQYLIAAGTLGSAPAGYITNVWFQVTANQTNTLTTLNIKLSQNGFGTNTSLLPQLYTTGLTTVYTAASATVSSGANGWMKIVLQTPFYYDPTQGLLVDVSQCAATNTGMQTINTAVSGSRRNYINASACTFSYGGQDANVFNFGVDITAGPPNSGGPGGNPYLFPPIGNFAYDKGIDTVWVNSPFAFVNNSIGDSAN